MFGQSDVGLDAEWRGDLLLDEATDAATVGEAHEFSGQPAERERVIRVRGTWCESRCSRGEPRDHFVPVEDVVELEWSVHGVQTGLMAQQLRDRDVTLAGLREVGPDVRDEIVVVE
ncbi:MAG: hypothetical protein RIQ63_1244 [Actinomycetota bacterium]